MYMLKSLVESWIMNEGLKEAEQHFWANVLIGGLLRIAEPDAGGRAILLWKKIHPFSPAVPLHERRSARSSLE